MAIPKTWIDTSTFRYDDHIQSPWAADERTQALAEISKLHAEKKVLEDRLRHAIEQSKIAHVSLWGTIADTGRIGIFRINDAHQLTNGKANLHQYRVYTDQIIWFDSLEEADNFINFTAAVTESAIP